MHRHILLAATGAFLFLGGCTSRPGGQAATTPSRDSSMTGTPASDSTFQATGRVRRVAVEGGCWRFDTGDGRHYELNPALAPAALLADGQTATLELRLRPDQMSTCQVGPMVEVVKVM